MRVLGISSATGVISIGLIDNEQVLLESTVAGAQAERIMFYIKEAGVEPSQVEGVAAAAGPGSYSGLRGGLAVAKSLAQTLNVPLVGISTLQAIAYNLIDIEGTIAVILDARADEYNFALFGASGGKLKRLTDDLVLKIDRLAGRLSAITGVIWVVGNLKDIKDIEDIKGGNFHFADEIHRHPYGINVARIGEGRIKIGAVDDPSKLNPVYSHSPSVREWRK